MRRVRMPYKRFSPISDTFLVTPFGSVFRQIEFFNSHRRFHQLRVTPIRDSSLADAPVPNMRSWGSSASVEVWDTVFHATPDAQSHQMAEYHSGGRGLHVLR